MKPESSAVPSSRRLDLAGGGWVLLLTGVVVVGICAWRLAAMWHTLGHAAVGDGQNIASYQFDLSNLRVPRELLVAGGLPRDGLPALIDPAVTTVADVRRGSRLAGVRVLHDVDPVIGVSRGGEARAYPLWVMAWHEVANDTLGGEPILVTYSGLCDSSVAFLRRVGDLTPTFGVSGLLYNSNLLMYDRVESGGASSLWSQLLFRAVSGPAAVASVELQRIPAEVVSWGEWSARYPDTTVVLPDPVRKRLYRRDAYLAYFGSPKLHYPVNPLPENGAFPLKTPIVATREADGWVVRSAVGASAPATLAVHSLWFAWYAMHPESRVVADGG